MIQKVYCYRCRRSLRLGNLKGCAGEGDGLNLHPAGELDCACQVDTGFIYEAQHQHDLEDAQGAESIGICGLFRRLKANCHMALGAQIIELIRLHLLNDPDQVGAVGKVVVVQKPAADHQHGDPDKDDQFVSY